MPVIRIIWTSCFLVGIAFLPVRATPSETVCPSVDARAPRIRVEGERFVLDGKPIWINGANTPWHIWDEFGGTVDGASYDPDWWDHHFAELAEAGVNATRVWLSCNGGKGIVIREDGFVVGPTPQFWKDVDSLMQSARRHGIYIMAALISFDHTKEGNPHYKEWRKMYASRANMDSFVENYAVPLARRYPDNPYLFSIDVCNEILWVSETEENDRGNFPWENLQYLVGRTAARVHEESEVLVCVSNYIKYVSPAYQGNKWTDAILREVTGHPLARIDFYKIHYYAWVYPHFGGVHFEKSPAHFGMTGKPAITGEISAKGVYYELPDSPDREVRLRYSLAEGYRRAMENGWQGMMAWTSNGVDAEGDLDHALRAATQSIAERFTSLVQPQ